MLFTMILYTSPRQVVQISSTSASMSPEPCKLRYIITCHLAKACIYRQLLHPSRPGCLSGPSLFPVLVASIFLKEISPFLFVKLPQLALFGWGVLLEPLAASGGLPRPLAPSGGLRRPPAASGCLWRPPGALRRPPAHSSASFCARCSPEPSGALLRPPAPSGLRRLPVPSGALWRPPAPSSALQRPLASADFSPVEGELQRKSVYYKEGSEGGRGQCSTCIALPKIFWT